MSCLANMRQIGQAILIYDNERAHPHREVHVPHVERRVSVARSGARH